MRSGVILRLCAVAAAVALIALPAGAQQRAAQVEQRLDAATAAEVLRIADSARTAGLPAEPLLDKALEGASKRADGRRIVDVVRGLARRMGEARASLGAGASESDIVAAAGAIYVGVPARELARLGDARRGQPVALPLVVLADLIERGVPVRAAMSAVLEVAGTGAGDAAFAALRREIEQDIAAGAPPAIAASTRARGAVFALPGGAVDAGADVTRGGMPTGVSRPSTGSKP